MKQYARNNTVLVSTHVLEDADMANRVIMLSHGRLVRDTDIETFKKVSRNRDISEAFRIISEAAKTETAETISTKHSPNPAPSIRKPTKGKNETVSYAVQ